LRFRTFSKAYGLAGARIGYCLGEAGLIRSFDKIRNHYGTNRVGQIGALAALQDQAFLAEAVAKIARARDKIATIAAGNGLRPLLSAANFVAIDCGRDGAFARRVVDELLARDVFVRMPSVAPLNRCIRVTCGRDEDLAVFAAALGSALAAASLHGSFTA
jgi:histidinol-phosphate aminotransferase